MKHILFALVALFINTSQAQVVDVVSKEQAIEILRSNKFIEIHRFSDNVSISVELLIREIEKITPLSPPKRNLLKQKLSEIATKKEGYWTDYTLLCWPSGLAPFVGTDADKVLKELFDMDVYRELSKRILTGWTTAIAAYDYLTLVQMEEQDWVVRGFISLPEYIETVYNYFGI